MMRFSVIIPVYNAEDFISHCLDSVLNQTFFDWEAVIVNDGSTDKSGEIADQYAEYDTRIRVLHKENGGQFFARKDGVAAARGEYVLFLDSDDFWPLDCLEKISTVIEDHRPDIVLFPGKIVGDHPRGEHTIGACFDAEGFIAKEQIYRKIASSHDLNSVCLKAFKRSLFEHDRTDYTPFKGVGFGEDKVMTLHPFTKAETIYYLDDILYYYRNHQTSTMHFITPERATAMLSKAMFRTLYQYMKQWGCDQEEYRELLAVYYLRSYIQVYYYIKRGLTPKGWEQFRQYSWKAGIPKEVRRYCFSTQLTWKEKLRLAAAYFFRI